jgi:hypothetical protein
MSARFPESMRRASWRRLRVTDGPKIGIGGPSRLGRTRLTHQGRSPGSAGVAAKV